MEAVLKTKVRKFESGQEPALVAGTLEGTSIYGSRGEIGQLADGKSKYQNKPRLNERRRASR